MSYIHDALRKAQKEKGAQAPAYEGILPAAVEKPKFSRGKALWLVPAVLVCAALVVYFRSSSKEAPVPGAVPSMPQATVGEQEQVAAQSDVRPAVQGTPPAGAVRAPGRSVRPQPKPTPTATSRPETAAAPPEDLTAPVLYERARLFHKSGRLPEAKALYEKALVQDPNYVDALNDLAVIQMRDGDYPAAREALLQAIRLKPDSVDAYYNLACVHALDGKPSESLIHLTKAVTLNRSAKDWARQDADLANLRGMPEFEEIIASHADAE